MRGVFPQLLVPAEKFAMRAPSLRYSEKFGATATYYRSLALVEPDACRAEILLDISALFLEMATNVADREKASSLTALKYPSQQPILFRNFEPALSKFGIGSFGGPILRLLRPCHIYFSAPGWRCHYFGFTCYRIVPYFQRSSDSGRQIAYAGHSNAEPNPPAKKATVTAAERAPV